MPHPLLHEELHAWRWLMRELRAELGVMFHKSYRKGRPRALGRSTETEIRARLSVVPRNRRMEAYRREAAAHSVSPVTIQRIVLQSYG